MGIHHYVFFLHRHRRETDEEELVLAYPASIIIIIDHHIIKAPPPSNGRGCARISSLLFFGLHFSVFFGLGIISYHGGHRDGGEGIWMGGSALFAETHWEGWERDIIPLLYYAYAREVLGTERKRRRKGGGMGEGEGGVYAYPYDDLRLVMSVS